MKRLLLLLLLVAHYTAYGQMDTEHWFAPFSDASNSRNQEQYLYLSTDSATPFEVQIYNNKLLYKTVTISKGAPGVVSVDRGLMIIDSRDVANGYKGTAGLYLKADHKFFAHFRFKVPNHAEIITSKGKAGIGTEFYTFTPENNGYQNFANSTVGITAVEDNTVITLDNFREGITLTGGETLSGSTVKTVTLNHGESYILETVAHALYNAKGLSGVHITATKNIAMTNGDFLVISPNGINVDIYMDQASPVSRIGTKYIAVKGNGNLGVDMEQIAIIATQDNTKIYVNGSTNPNFTIAKKGQTQLIPSSYYTLASSSADAYNMFIETDKPVYAYQLLAGVDDGSNSYSYASGGMNILPQLLCLLPNKVDEFALVDQIGNSTYDTRLNIVTQAGAKVKVNGADVQAGSGPFPVPGNPGWETYTIQHASGNIAIESDKAVTAGIASGDRAVGFGGYFAGFNSAPVIAKGGDCATNSITLEVDDTYDTYEWFLNNVKIEGATGPKIHAAVAGTYKAKISKLSCATVVTPDFKLLACPANSETNYSIARCQSLNIQPKFSKSSQGLSVQSVTIIDGPQHGTATVNADGTITYTATSITATSDVFKYYFEGNDPDFPDSEYVTVHITIRQITTRDTEAISCLNEEGFGVYDLRKAFESANPEYPLYEFFTSAGFDSLAKIPEELLSSYLSKPNQTVYVKVVSADGCDNQLQPAKILLKTYELPVVTKIAVISENSAEIYIEKGRQPYSIAVKKGQLDSSAGPAPSEYKVYNGATAKVSLTEGAGYYTAFVKSADGCAPTIAYFTVIKLPNAFTPNGDDYNNVFDASALMQKTNAVLQIFDRFGRKVFEGETANGYKWDGSINKESLPTGTYWYVSKWQDYAEATPHTVTGWILLKRR